MGKRNRNKDSVIGEEEDEAEVEEAEDDSDVEEEDAEDEIFGQKKKVAKLWMRETLADFGKTSWNRTDPVLI